MVERQSKMGEKRVSRKPKSLRVFGHPPRRAKTRLRAGLYARVSTQDQQTLSLIHISFCEARVPFLIESSAPE